MGGRFFILEPVLSILLELYAVLILVLIEFLHIRKTSPKNRTKMSSGGGDQRTTTTSLLTNGRSTSATSFDDDGRCSSCLDSDTGIHEAKATLINSMRREADGVRNNLQSAQTHCRKLQRLIDQRDKELIDSKRLIEELKAENGKMAAKQHHEYVPCDALRYRRFCKWPPPMSPSQERSDDELLQQQQQQQKSSAQSQKEKNAAVIAELEKRADEETQKRKDAEAEMRRLIRDRAKDELQLQTQADQNTDLRERAEQESQKRAEAEAEIQRLIRERSAKIELQLQLQSQRDQNADLRERAEQESQKRADAEAEIQRLIRERSIFELQLQTQADQNADFRKRADQESQKRADAEIELQRLTREKSVESRFEKDKNAAVVGDLQKRADEETRKRAEAEAEIQRLTAEKNELRQKLEDEISTSRRQDETIVAIERRRDHETGQRKDLQSKLDEMTKEKRDLQDAWIDLNKRYEEYERVIQSNKTGKGDDAAAAKLRKADDRLREVSRENESLKNQLHDAMTNMDNKRQSTKDECNAKLRSDLKEAMDKIQHIAGEKELLDKMYKVYKEKAETEICQKDLKIAQLEKSSGRGSPAHRVVQFKADHDSVELRKADERIEEMCQDKEMLQSQLRDSLAKLDKSKDAFRELRSSMNEAMGEIDRYKQEKENFEKLYKSSKERMELEQQQQQQKETKVIELIDPQSGYYPSHHRDRDDIETRLRLTEEHVGELRRENLMLKDELRDTLVKLDQSEQAYGKIRSGMQEALEKIAHNQKERDYFERLYKSYKGKVDVEVLKKDTTIAQQDKLITHLQSRISTPKKMCCWSQEKKNVGQLTMDDLGKALDAERAKNVDLKCVVRRLQQELKEKHMRRSFSNEHVPFASGE